MVKILGFCVLVCVGLIPCSLLAEENSPVSIALQAGMGSGFSPSGFDTVHKKAFLLGGRLGYELSDRWSIGGQLSSYNIGSDTSPAQNVRLAPLTVWAQREFPWTRFWTPYVLAGAGLSRNKSDAISNGKAFTGWTAGLSLGIRLKLSDGQDLSIEAGTRQFSKAAGEGQDLRLFEGGVVLRFFLPESWVPMKPNVGISDADLEIPLVSDGQEEELDSTRLAQEELTRLQIEIDTKKIPPISFDPKSAILQTASFKTLDELGAILRRYPDVRIRIYGFVDEGHAKENGEALALARSQVVGTYVVQNFYLNESRFVSLGERPLPATPATPIRRRIEFEAIPGR